jgi:cell division protein FtsB
MKAFVGFVKKSFFRIAIFVFVVYIFITVGRSIWKNYSINKEIEALETEIKELQLVNESLTNRIAYFKTNTYKELALREKLNMQKPGETMVLLPKKANEDENLIISNPEKNTDTVQGDKKPNNQLWIEYFTK